MNRQMILNIHALDCAIPLFKGRLKLKVVPPFREDIVVSDTRAALLRVWLGEADFD